MSEPESRLPLPRRTTPTWEMELLVSGVTVFALLQLPGWMDRLYLGLHPRLDMNWAVLAQLLFIYCKMGTLILAAAFVLHLALRGYWIALIGMDSIYPEGVRWERLRMGPVQRRFLQGRAVRSEERIENADNRASIVFAVGITMAMVMAGLVFVLSLAFAAATALAFAFGWRWLLPYGAFGLLFLGALPYALAYQIDRRWGERMSSDGRAARAISAVFAFYSRLGYSRNGNPTMNLLQSHVGDRKTTLLTLVAMMLCAVFAMAQLVLQQKNLSLGDYALWPAAEVGADDSLVASHYRDQARPDNSLLPTIDGMFPTGDYLSLIVPFNPKRHPALLDRICPSAWRDAASPMRRAALLDCLGRWLDVRLDGQPLPATGMRYGADPKSGQAALIAIVPIRGLATGEHALTLKQVASVDDPKPTPRYRIVFWR